MSRKIFIFDTTLRDGEQSPGASMNSQEKFEIGRQLEKLNVDIIEAGFPASSPEDFESVRRIAREIKRPTICALARATEGDINRAAEALKHAEKPMIHTFIGTSDIHIKGQLKKTRDQVLKMAIDAVKLAKSYCYEVEFSAMDATRTERAYLWEVVSAVIEAGATVINIPDTVGCALPNIFGDLISALLLSVPLIGDRGVRVSVHCHDDLGLATANTIAAVANGATQIECAVNGMGERAGNTSLEEVVAAIRHNGIELDAHSDIQTQEFAKTSRLVSEITGFAIAPNKAIAGANAFVHSSGIHQDGVLKERSTFEILDKADWGYGDVKTIVLTSRSGKTAVKTILADLGLQIPEESFPDFLSLFKELADKKKSVNAGDLQALAETFLRGTGELSISTVSMSAVAEGYEAMVVVQKGTEILNWSGWAKDGPVDAIIRAIQDGINANFDLVDYNVKSVGSGGDAQARVIVRVKFNGTVVRGMGLDTDTLKATASAYLDAAIRAKERQAEQKKIFRPTLIGKPQTLIAGQMYEMPERPAEGLLLAAVKGNEIAFFRSDTWRGGHYKSRSGWMFFNTALLADAVCFPQFRLGKTSQDHRHGLPDFYKDGGRLE